VSVCLFFTRFHTVAPISIKFGTVVQDFSGDASGKWNRLKFWKFPQNVLVFARQPFVLAYFVFFFILRYTLPKNKSFAYSLCLAVTVSEILNFRFSKNKRQFLKINPNNHHRRFRRLIVSNNNILLWDITCKCH
jgi:hypothetical protein